MDKKEKFWDAYSDLLGVVLDMEPLDEDNPEDPILIIQNLVERVIPEEAMTYFEQLESNHDKT